MMVNLILRMLKSGLKLSILLLPLLQWIFQNTSQLHVLFSSEYLPGGTETGIQRQDGNSSVAFRASLNSQPSTAKHVHSMQAKYFSWRMSKEKDTRAGFPAKKILWQP